MNAKTDARKRIRSPEELDAAIKISTPGVWAVVILSSLLLVAFMLWACTGSIRVTVDAVAYVSGSEGVIYLPAEKMGGIDTTKQVLMDGSYHSITKISVSPISVEKLRLKLSDEVIYRLNISSSVYEICFDAAALEEGTRLAGIVTEEIRPISFIFKSE